MNVRATRLTVAGLAGGVILALTLHLFMLAGASSHPASGGDMGSVTVAAASAHATAPQPAPHDPAGHPIIGCFAVLAALVLLFGVATSGRQGSSHGRASSGPDGSPLRPPGDDLPPIAGSLVAAGVLLRV